MRFFGKSVRTPNKVPRLPILAVGGLLGAALAMLAPAARAQTSRQAGAGQPPVQHRPAQSPPTSGSEAQQLLEWAIIRLESYQTISARIAHSVDLFGHKRAGSGVYLEERSDRGLRLRLEVRIRLAGETGGLLHVCDGQNLWRYQKLGDNETLTSIDIVRVQEALENSGDMKEIGKVGWWPGLGGLPRLLRGLHAAFDFTTVEPIRLVQPPLSAWRLRGQWKAEKLAELLPDQRKNLAKGKPVDLQKLPPHVPDQVVLYLGQTDWFPYRIEYRRRQPKEHRGADAAEDRAVVTIKLDEVSLNASIHPTHFLYSPGDLPVTDGTGQFLKDLGLAP